MGILSGSGKDAMEICKALQLPPRTFAFSFRMRVGEPAVLEVESYVDASIGDELVTVLKRYQLQEIEGPNGSVEPGTTVRRCGSARTRG